MKHRWRRGAAVLLTTSMLFSNINMTGLAEDDVEIQAVEETQSEIKPVETETATEAPTEAATEAPTEAATEAPTEAATEAPTEAATEAPTEAATEALTEAATEAPTEAKTEAATEMPTEAKTEAATEIPTEAKTEAPTETTTEAATEKQTEDSEKESETEGKTEKQTEQAEGIYTAEEKNYTVTVEVPDEMDLPQGAQLVADVVKRDSTEAKYDLTLAEEAAEGCEISGYQIYDLHFEKDNREIELAAREKADIKVTISIGKEEFDKDLEEKGLKIFHIRDLTEKEKAEKEKEFTFQETGPELESETEMEKEESVYRTAEERKIGKIEKKDGQEIITFVTDGFSDYLFAVTKEKKPKVDARTLSQQDKKVQEQSGNLPDDEITPLVVDGTDGQNKTDIEQKDSKFTTLTLKVIGKEGAAGVLTITAEKDEDLTRMKEEGEAVKITDASGKDIKGATVKKNVLTIPVSGKETLVKVENLPLYVYADTALEDGTKQPAYYVIDSGGNYLNKKESRLTAEYYTVYEDNDGKLMKDQEDGKVTLTASEEELNLTVKNIYSSVEVTSVGSDAKDKKFTGMKYTVTSKLYGDLDILAKEEDGITTIKGLPEEHYTITGDKTTIPKEYFEDEKFTEVDITNSKSQVATTLTYKPMTVTVKVLDGNNQPVKGVKVKLLLVEGKKLKGISIKTNSKGEIKKTGFLKRGETYKIYPENLSGHYAPESAQVRKNYRYTVKGEGENPNITFTNQATVVKVGVIDDVSETSPYSGSYVAGATVEIRSANGAVLKTITTESQPVEVKGLMDPGVTYEVWQTAAPAGYIVGAINASGFLVKAKRITLSSSKRTERLVQISADTVKVLISRKGYDSRTEVTKDGKTSYEYKNLKYLGGAKLEIRDKDGKVVKDKNGTPLSWTTDADGGHMVEGVLAADTKYTLVETVGPDGYDVMDKNGFFYTYKSGNKAMVTVLTGKTAGTIRVFMRASYQKTAIKVNGTFYCALFLDKDLNQRYTEAGVKSLVMSTDQVYAEAKFENIPLGTYYVAETDQKGNVLRDNATFKVNNPDQALRISSTNKNLIAEITNDYATQPQGAKTVSKSELQNSYKSEYENYGGSASAASQSAAAGNSVQTGDNTNIALYVVLLIVALGIVVVVLVRRKKR